MALAVGVIAVGLATPLGARAASTFDLHRGTSSSRFSEWRIATRTIADHPLLGVGPEGYRVVFPQEVDAAYVRDYGSAVYPDRAHNGVLDVTLDGGLLAGALYLALLVLALRHAARGVRARDPIADRARRGRDRVRRCSSSSCSRSPSSTRSSGSWSACSSRAHTRRRAAS